MHNLPGTRIYYIDNIDNVRLCSTNFRRGDILLKVKLLSVLLLLISFGGLGILSGAIPVMAENAVTAGSPSAETSPPPSLSPTQTPVTTAASGPTPEPSPAPTEATESTATPLIDAWEPDAAVVATTITSDSPLDNDTGYEVDAQAMLSQDLNITLEPDGYHVLIIHTHSTEAYTPDGDDQYEATDAYRTTDPEHSVIRVGEALAEALEAYGIHVLHDTGLYDYPSYNGSYARSGAAVEEYLAAYPDIALVIDLHRDAIGDEDMIYKTVSGGAAQIMFVMGSDVNLEHPNWRKNLQTALSLQGLVTRQFDSLMRPTTLCPYRYNQQLSPGSLLMEVGTSGNTLQEAVTAVQLFAEAVGPALAARILV